MKKIVIAIILAIVVATAIFAISRNGSHSKTLLILSDIELFLNRLYDSSGLIFDTLDCRASDCQPSAPGKYPTHAWRLLAFSAFSRMPPNKNANYQGAMLDELQNLRRTRQDASIEQIAVNTHQLVSAFDLSGEAQILDEFYNLLPVSAAYVQAGISQGMFEKQLLMLTTSSLYNLYAAARLEHSAASSGRTQRFPAKAIDEMVTTADEGLALLKLRERNEPFANTISENPRISQFSCYLHWVQAERFAAAPKDALKEELKVFARTFSSLNTESISKFESAMNLAPCAMGWARIRESDPQFDSAYRKAVSLIQESVDKLDCGFANAIASIELGGAKGPRCIFLTSENAWVAAALAQ